MATSPPTSSRRKPLLLLLRSLLLLLLHACASFARCLGAIARVCVLTCVCKSARVCASVCVRVYACACHFCCCMRACLHPCLNFICCITTECSADAMLTTQSLGANQGLRGLHGCFLFLRSSAFRSAQSALALLQAGEIWGRRAGRAGGAP